MDTLGNPLLSSSPEKRETPKKHWLRLDVQGNWVRLNYEGDVSVLAKHFLEELINHPELAMAILSDLANDHFPQN